MCVDTTKARALRQQHQDRGGGARLVGLLHAPGATAVLELLTPVLQHSWKFLRLFLMRKIFTPMYVHVCALFFIVQRVALCIIQIAS